jgi:hypothetical protein
MELISERNGLRLFCYRFSDEGISVKGNKSVASIKDPILLIVYKSNDFYLQLTKVNTSALLDFFHVDGSIFD